MKPGDFYVGLLDFFAILLPGAIATSLLAPRLGGTIGKLVAMPAGEAALWVAFLVCAYFLGHLIFLAGSYLDFVYNLLRERFRPYGNESAYQCATRVRDSMIDASERRALNTFQWSRSVLVARCPACAEDVHRLEADSKFFRSLLVVLALASCIFFAEGHMLAGFAALVLAVPCFARYFERRLKGTTQAYIHIVTLHRLGQLGAAGKDAS